MKRVLVDNNGIIQGDSFTTEELADADIAIVLPFSDLMEIAKAWPELATIVPTSKIPRSLLKFGVMTMGLVMDLDAAAK